MDLALDHVPLHAVRVRDLEELVPVHALLVRLAGLAENAVERHDPRPPAVLLGVEREGAVRILDVLCARVDPGVDGPAHVLLHLHGLVGMGEEIVPERGAVRHLDAVLEGVVVDADLAAHRRAIRRGLVVEVAQFLREVVDLLVRRDFLVAVAPGRHVPAAGAVQVGIAVGEVELAELFVAVGRELPVPVHVRPAHLKAVVREHLLELFGLVVVVAGELHALVADRLDVRERLGEPFLLDVLVDRVELQGDLAGTRRARRRQGMGRGRRQRRAGAETGEKFSSCRHLVLLIIVL